MFAKSAYVATLAIAVTPLVGVAHADDSDELYLGILDMYGVPYTNAAAVITAGHYVCKVLGDGYSLSFVGRDVEANSGWTPEQAGHMVGAAIGSYCPKFEAEVPGH